MPILKQLMLSSSQAKRHSRVDLTAEMISAPLGDFRHTMHVGRGGDAFGDTSFLEPPQDVEQRSSPKQSLLARTFRSSKRSHSSSRTDRPENSKPPGESPSYVKNAISLPYLNDEDASRARGAGLGLTKSVSSSPAKNFSEANRKPANGPIPPAVRDLELIERDFGELTDLPVSSVPPCGGMKHAESVLSFHIDLGPSMLGDILSVMDRKGDTGLRCEDELDSPKLHLLREPVEEGGVPPVRPPRLRHAPTSPYTSELLSPMAQRHPNRRSTEDQPHNPLHHRARDDTRYTPPTRYAPPTTRDDRDISYMDEDDDEDEIRV